MLIDLMFAPLKVLLIGFMSLFPTVDSETATLITNTINQISTLTVGLNQIIPLDNLLFVLRFVLSTELILFGLRLTAKVVKLTTLGKVDFVPFIPHGRIGEAVNDE